MAEEGGTPTSWTPLLDAARDLTGADLTYVAVVEETPTPLTVLAVSGDFPADGGLREIRERLVAPAFDGTTPFVARGERVAGTSIGRSGRAVHVAVLVPTADGLPSAVLCAADPSDEIASPPRVTALRTLAGVVSDRLREQRRAAELTARAVAAEAELGERGMLLDGARHELHTPIAVINGWLELLETGPSGAGSWEAAREAIRRATAQLRGTVDLLVEESRALTPRRGKGPGPTVLADCVVQVVEDLQVLSPDHDLRCQSTNGTGSVAAEIDPEALRTVLGHLVDNALKYSPSGTQVTVSIARTDAGRAAIGVADRGVGLPPDVDIFEPYQRGQTATEGTGLGLYIVRRIVHAAGGDVVARNNPEGGATFHVLLPVASRGQLETADR